MKYIFNLNNEAPYGEYSLMINRDFVRDNLNSLVSINYLVNEESLLFSFIVSEVGIDKKNHVVNVRAIISQILMVLNFKYYFPDQTA